MLKSLSVYEIEKNGENNEAMGDNGYLLDVIFNSIHLVPWTRLPSHKLLALPFFTSMKDKFAERVDALRKLLKLTRKVDASLNNSLQESKESQMESHEEITKRAKQTVESALHSYVMSSRQLLSVTQSSKNKNLNLSERRVESKIGHDMSDRGKSQHAIPPPPPPPPHYMHNSAVVMHSTPNLAHQHLGYVAPPHLPMHINTGTAFGNYATHSMVHHGQVGFVNAAFQPTYPQVSNQYANSSSKNHPNSVTRTKNSEAADVFASTYFSSSH